MIPICEELRLSCFTRPHSYPVGLVIRRLGQTIGDCKIAYAKPLPCIVGRSTSITVSDRCDVETEELKHNILLKLNYGSSQDYLIYPKKVWDKISYMYIEPLSKGEVPKEPGLLLYGPPGTGKTSMIDMMAMMLGVYKVEVTPNVLSAYVGESEKNLAKKFMEAETNQPALVKMDDAEWLVKSRDFAMSGGGAEATVSLTLLNLVLNKVQDWKRERKRILMIVATNKQPSAIDPALMRSGRLGRKPVFIPLPNFEAIYTLMERKRVVDKIGEKETRSLAMKLANLGVNMADVNMFIQEILDGRKPELEEVRGRGYIRPVPPDLTIQIDKLMKKLRRLLIPRSLESPFTRLYIAGESSILEPLLIYYTGQIGKTVVMLNDERYFDEAMTTAETTKSVLIIDTDSITDERVLKLVNSTARSPVIYIGKTMPPVNVMELFTLDDIEGILKENRDSLKLIFSYYNIEYTDEEIREFLSKHRTDLTKVLKKLRLWATGLKLRDIIESEVTYISKYT